MRGKDNMRSGGEVLVDQLLVNGVRHVFCVPGESYLAALDAFHDRDIAVTVCRQEGGAVMMAEAHGKLTGRPGIAFVTRGPGATNGSPGMHIAQQDSTPMIMFVGQVAREMRDREAFQELDYRAVFGTMAKWVTEIDDPARIPEIVSRAFHVAMNGRPGPVVIALPEDMLMERVSVGDALAADPIETWPGLTDMSQLQKMLWAAEKPIVILGGSRWSETACAATLRFAERFDVPVVTSFRRAASLPGDASLLRGRPRHRRQSEGRGAREGGRSPAAGRRAARRDAEPGLHAARHSEPEGKIHPRLSGLRTSSATSTGPISPSMRRRPHLPHRSKACSRRTRSAGAPGPRTRTTTTSPGRKQPTKVPGAVNFGEIMVWLRGQLPPDSIITNGAGNFSTWMHRFYRFTQIRDAARPDLRLDGLRVAGRGRREAALSGAHGGVRCRRRRLPDERAGVRDRRSIRSADHRADHGQRHVRHDPRASGARISRPRDRDCVCAIRISPPMRAPSAASARRSRRPRNSPMRSTPRRRPASPRSFT